MYYLDFDRSQHSLLKRVKEHLKESMKAYEDDFDSVLPSTLENERSMAIDSITAEEVAVFLYNVLDSYVSTMFMFETKLSKEGRLGNCLSCFFYIQLFTRVSRHCKSWKDCPILAET